MDRLTIFWLVHLALLGLFGLEMLLLLWIWLGARVPGLPRDASRGHKLGVIIGRVLRSIFSHRLGTFMKALVLDGMVHRQLFRVSKLRWFAHTAVFWSFLVLGVFSTITGVAVELLNPHPEHSLSPIVFPVQHPIVEALVDMDHPVMAVLNEGFGLLLLAGLALVFWRRYLQRDAQLRTQGPDNAILVLLAVIVVGGYVLEALRFLAEGVPASLAIFGPLGYGLALLLGFLPLSQETWAGIHYWAFFAHFISVSLLLFYLPFSKFFHIVSSPLVVALNTILVGEQGGVE